MRRGKRQDGNGTRAEGSRRSHRGGNGGDREGAGCHQGSGDDVHHQLQEELSGEAGCSVAVQVKIHCHIREGNSFLIWKERKKERIIHFKLISRLIINV